MREEEKGFWAEATVTINGKMLTTAQVMSLRVACQTFQMAMSEPEALGDDPVGMELASNYTNCIKEVNRLLVEKV